MIDLEVVSTTTLMVLSDNVEGALAAITKAESSIRRMTIKTEKQLSELTTRSWKRAATGSLAASLPAYRKRGSASRKSMRQFLKALAAPLASPLTAAQKTITEGLIRRIYKRSLKLTEKEVRAELSFGLRSTRTTKAIRRHHVFWVGDFYTEQLSRRIAGVTEDVILNQGLSFRAASAELGPVLGREFGIVAGGQTAFAPTIPARYAGNPEFYFRQLSSVAAQQARVFSKVEGFQQAEVITYRLTNPDDKATGLICQQMSGQVFTVEVAVNHVDKFLDAESPEDIKKIQPWISGEVIKEALDGAPKGSQDATDKLMEAGAILPPFHSLCRTEPVVLSFSQ